MVLWGSGDGAGRFWLLNTTTGRVCGQALVSRYTVNDLAVCADGERIVTADAAGTVKVWSCRCWNKNVDIGGRVEEPQLLTKWMAHVQPITRICLAESKARLKARASSTFLQHIMPSQSSASGGSTSSSSSP